MKMPTNPDAGRRRFLALATDYDETLATDSMVSDATFAALERLRASGRKLLLVTGRELTDVQRIFPRCDIFDKIVAENGAFLYTPATGKERPLGPAPSPDLVQRLREQGVKPLFVGRSVISTHEPHEVAALETIKELGLELEIIFNKGSVMIVPSGINKATGLAAALEEMGLSAENVVGIGDAENDHAFLAAVGYGVAVANALPKLKEAADHVTRGSRSAGVVEFIDELISQDAAIPDSADPHAESGADSSEAPAYSARQSIAR
ncbi:HAD family hydrolase [Mesorhizobium sp. BAC0120]|uniref:HAD family hydrolase n=1 Tax=Mesorhizobium sp. BAC0120 TaxID=3090670 RepID=UPI00298C9989|nr:HAD family hydrolase [Mesorhizobium sp. BAC0120]MDW6020182.1 HAD family hydrolase [Mesorhizobium sp. BAC0120]